MDAVKFIEERNRMCKSFDDGCTGCPAFNACKDEICCAVDQESKLDAAEQIAMVEKWSAEHLRKTRQDVFLEQYPEANIDEHGVLNVCPLYVSAAYRDSNGLCSCPEKLCADCCSEFWMQKVE